MARNDDWWRSDRGHRDGWTSGERDVRNLGSHRDYGRGMLDDMHRYARGGSERPGHGGGWESRDTGRGFVERAGDEMASWFGDDDAERRRRADEKRAQHRGRGPRGYTRSDERIREDVSDRLTDDPYVDASDIEVTVSGCEVTLSGTVDDRRTRRRAEDVAESVSGVRHVQNNLRVRRYDYGGAGTSAGAGAMADIGSGSAAPSSSGDTETTGTPGRMNAPADLHTADTDSVTRR